jgi:hypothetical protein
VGNGKVLGTYDVVGGSLCDRVESGEDDEMDVKGIAGSPGAVNIFTSDIDPGICHEFSMSKNKYWVLGAMPGSPVILALMKSWDVKEIKGGVVGIDTGR